MPVTPKVWLGLAVQHAKTNLPQPDALLAAAHTECSDPAGKFAEMVELWKLRTKFWAGEIEPTELPTPVPLKDWAMVDAWFERSLERLAVELTYGDLP